MKIKLFLDKSVNENASFYFEKSKKAKKKIEGTRKAIEELEKKLKALKSKEKKSERRIEKSRGEGIVAKKSKGKKWYYNFRWFYTTNNFLAVGGKDASTNEILIKKYAESEDLIFHTDMQGSPFFILKTSKKTPKKEDIEEVAQATASFSKAWKLKVMYLEVYYVRSEQVSKKTKAGEYIKKGSFMIYGKRNYLRPKLRLAIGVSEDEIIVAPVKVVEHKCNKFVVIEPGDREKSKIAIEIIKKLALKPSFKDEVMRKLPSGGSSIIGGNY